MKAKILERVTFWNLNNLKLLFSMYYLTSLQSSAPNQCMGDGSDIQIQIQVKN